MEQGGCCPGAAVEHRLFQVLVAGVIVGDVNAAETVYSQGNILADITIAVGGCDLPGCAVVGGVAEILGGGVIPGDMGLVVADEGQGREVYIIDVSRPHLIVRHFWCKFNLQNSP